MHLTWTISKLSRYRDEGPSVLTINNTKLCPGRPHGRKLPPHPRLGAQPMMAAFWRELWLRTHLSKPAVFICTLTLAWVPPFAGLLISGLHWDTFLTLTQYFFTPTPSPSSLYPDSRFTKRQALFRCSSTVRPSLSHTSLCFMSSDPLPVLFCGAKVFWGANILFLLRLAYIVDVSKGMIVTLSLASSNLPPRYTWLPKNFFLVYSPY